MTDPTRRTRRAAMLERAADNLILFGCWMALLLIGACIGAALMVSVLHRLGRW